MAANKVMKLWTAIVTAFLALFAALGFAASTTATAATAAPQAEETCTKPVSATAPMSAPHWSLALLERSLPPTMKQRIRAESHGSSPTCRHTPLADTDATDATATTQAKDVTERTEQAQATPARGSDHESPP